MNKRNGFWGKWYGGALVLACLFWLVSYFVTNLDFPLSGEKQIMTWVHYITNHRNISENDDNVVFIDVSYDQQMVDATDMSTTNHGEYYHGTAAIPDRGKLLKLLQYFREDTTRYRYIFLDIEFDESYCTEFDSALYDCIKNMPRIVVADGENIPYSIKSKAEQTVYYQTLNENNFVKFPYTNSAPLKMYEEITGSHIRRIGPFYFDGCRLARKSVVQTLEIGANDYTHLGEWTCGDSSTYFGCNCSGQFVIVGAISTEGNDIHNTYRGEMSGPEINYNAFISLMNGHHRVSWIVSLLIFLLFYYYCFKILRQNELSKKIIKGNRWYSRILVTFISWLNYPFWLTLLCIITFLIWKEIYDILITTTLFFILKTCVRILSKKV